MGRCLLEEMRILINIEMIKVDNNDGKEDQGLLNRVESNSDVCWEYSCIPVYTIIRNSYFRYFM